MNGAAGGDADGRTLVVIDLQNVFADPASPWAAPRFAEITPVIARLIERFTPNVVLTRFVAPEHPTGAWVRYYQQWPFALQPADSPLWQLVPELDAGSHPVIDRPNFGKWGAELRATVAGSAGLVLCGVSTDCCVLSTALPAADDGMAVEVVADACAGASDADHQRALDAMALYAPLITITTETTLP